MECIKGLELTLEGIKRLAVKNSDKAWEVIDASLPSHCEDSEFIDWARSNLFNNVLSLRDLAATILGLSKVRLTETDIENLSKLMEEITEENIYPRFRAAVALAKRLTDARIMNLKDRIKKTVSEYLADEGVGEIAREVLQGIN